MTRVLANRGLRWPEAARFYLVARDGLFLCRNHRFFSSVVPATDWPAELEPQVPMIQPRFPRLRRADLERVVGLFVRLAEVERRGGVLLAWNHDLRRVEIVPWLQNGGGTDHLLPDGLPASWGLFGEIASRASSSRRRAEFAAGAWLHVVAERLDRDPPTFRAEVEVDGWRFPLSSRVAGLDCERRRSKSPTVAAWLDRILHGSTAAGPTSRRAPQPRADARPPVQAESGTCLLCDERTAQDSVEPCAPVLAKTADFVWPEGLTRFWLLAANGLFSCREEEFCRSATPACDWPTELERQHACLRPDFPLIPQRDFERIVGFFARIASDLGTEASVLLAWNADAARVEIIVPPQRATAASVRYELPRDLPSSWTVFGDAHSHCNMGAAASGVDEHDEKYGNAGIHLVVGRISQEPPEFHVEAVVDGMRFPLHWTDVAAGYERRDLTFPELEQWVGMVEKVSFYGSTWRWAGFGDRVSSSSNAAGSSRSVAAVRDTRSPIERAVASGRLWTPAGV